MEGTAESRKPADTDFKQQRLRAWQPILTPWWVIGTFLVVGIVFVPLGVTINDASNSVVEIAHKYDGASVPQGGCQGVTYPRDNPRYTSTSTRQNYNKNCTISVTVPAEMTAPVYVYYELDNFYQNHRQYVKSRSEKQLVGKSNPTTNGNCDPLEIVNQHQICSSSTDCKPGVTPGVKCGQNNRCQCKQNSECEHGMCDDGMCVQEQFQLVPCGLIANSLFNDTFTLQNQAAYNWTETDIAWQSELNNKFRNSGEALYNASEAAKCTGDLYGGNNNCTCEGVTNPVSAKTATNPVKCKKYLQQSYPTVPGIVEQGVENEHFIVWMRTAGLPRFRKLYATINKDLQKGEVLTFDVQANFPVHSFGGSKSLVLSTTSWVGGKNHFLGTAYIVVGVVCLLLGVAFLVKHMRNPRQLGDMSKLKWGQGHTD
jgi:hypothetical protein